MTHSVAFFRRPGIAHCSARKHRLLKRPGLGGFTASFVANYTSKFGCRCYRSSVSMATEANINNFCI